MNVLTPTLVGMISFIQDILCDILRCGILRFRLMQRALQGRFCSPVRSTWGISPGEDNLGARARMLNTKVSRRARAGQTSPFALYSVVKMGCCVIQSSWHMMFGRVKTST